MAWHTEALSHAAGGRPDTHQAKRGLVKTRSLVGAWEWDIPSGSFRLSERILALLGAPPRARPLGMEAFLSVIHKGDRDRAREALVGASENRQGLDLAVRAVSRDGSVRWLELRGDLLMDDSMRPARLVGTAAAISANTSLPRWAREGEWPLKLFIDTLPTAVYTTDSAGRLTLYNEAAASLWGQCPELGKSVWCGSWRLLWPDGTPMRHDECPMAVALREQRAIVGAEAIAERPDGTRVPFLAYPTPLFDENGTLTGAVNMLVDISDRKRLDGERARHVREVEGLNARLQRAMAETHHRVKNNLQVIAAMIDMTAMRGDSAVTADDVRSLGAHVRALAVVHEILTQEAKRDGQAEVVSIKDVLSRLVTLLGRSWGEQGIIADVDDAALPIRTATGVALVTNELILNAIKYGRRSVQVRLRLGSGDATLEVSDGGPGFPEGFDPDRLETTGIDLVRNLSRWDLGGKVTFRNAESGGAVATVQFPLPSAGTH